jgi:MscS family membrane protein
MALTDFVLFGNTALQYIFFACFVVGGIIGGKILYWISANIIRKLTAKTETRLDDLLIEALERPAIFLLFVIGFRLGVEALTLGVKGQATFINITKILVIINVAWFIIKFVDAMIENYLIPAVGKSKSDLDDALLPIVRKIVNIIIIVITLILIIDNFGYDVSSLIAGLGIGGLAFALAAQDLLANFFGGLAILSDKPFKIGDRIRLDEKNDGFIREIGMRTTRMETFDGTMVIIPNRKIADSIFENISKEPARRVKAVLNLTYDTTLTKMDEAKRIIKEAVRKHKDTKEEVIVAFTHFGASSLDMTVIYWVTNTDKLFDIQDDVNRYIKRHFEKVGIEFAYPTQTLYVKEDPEALEAKRMVVHTTTAPPSKTTLKTAAKKRAKGKKSRRLTTVRRAPKRSLKKAAKQKAKRRK